MHYYTYAYLREDRTPYYIGKGKGDRIYSASSRIIKPPKDKSRIIYLKQNLTEEEAFRHEIYMIDVLGRKDLGTGILHNRTDGGEGASGAIRSDETKKRMSEAGKGRIFSEEHMRKLSVAKKNISEETRRKLSEVQKGKILSEETRRKLSEVHKGKTPSEETRRKMSEAHKGNTYCLGKNHSEETKKKMSEALKGKTFSEERKKVMSEVQKGKILSEETKKKMSEAKKGKKWWNNGIINTMMVECPGDSWKPGRKC
jgi:hypothetical protein